MKEGKTKGKKITNKKLITYAIVAAIMLVLFLLLSKLIMSAFLITATIVLAFIVNAANIKWTGLELITFSTVIFGIVYGPMVGALMGLILVIIHLLLGQYLGLYFVWVVPGYAVLGFLAGTLTLSVTTLGIVLTIGMNLVFTIITGLITPPSLGRYVPYAFFNIVFNIILFKLIAPLVVQIMSV